MRARSSLLSRRPPLPKSKLIILAGRVLTPIPHKPLQPKRRQPPLPPHRPQLVSRPELVGLVQRAEVQVHFLVPQAEHAAPAGRAEVAALPFAGCARDAHRLPVEDGGGEEQGAAVLAAVEAVAQPTLLGSPRA